MFCRKCGNEIADGARFCTHCGAEVAQKKVETEPVRTGKKKWGVVASVCTVLVLVLAIAAVLWLKSNADDEGREENSEYNEDNEQSDDSEQDEDSEYSEDNEQSEDSEYGEESGQGENSGNSEADNEEEPAQQSEEKDNWNDVRVAYLTYLEAQGAFEPSEMPADDDVYGRYPNYFSLDYVDGDDIPELIYGQAYWFGGDGERLISCSLAQDDSQEKAAINVDMIEAEFIEYIEGTGMVDCQYGHNYARENHIYQLTGGKFVFLESGEYNDASALDDGNENWLDGWDGALWEGEEMAKKEYVERWTSIYAGKGERSYSKHSYTPNEMREILQTSRTSEELKIFLEHDTGYETE